MKETAFVCLGSHGEKNAFFYRELPRREGGEEFFVFFSPGSRNQEPLVKKLFRYAISSSRLGNPSQYFVQLIDRLKDITGMEEADEDLFAGSIIMIMIRRDKKVYLFHKRDVEIVHWNGNTGIEGSIDSITGIDRMPLKGIEGQGNLFNRLIEEMFILRCFSVTEGNHTLIFVPSRDFPERHGETLRNSIFFPSFLVPADGKIEIETVSTFPAIHWNRIEEKTVRRESRVSTPSLRRFSLPVAAGVIATVAALFLFFGPLSKKESTQVPVEPPVLLSAEEDERPAAGREETEAEPDETNPPGRALSLSEDWRKSFESPVTSSPVCYRETIYFGCRDGHMYAFNRDGSEKWKHFSGRGIGASPCCTGEYVIGANYAGEVICLDAETGEKVWSFSTNEKIVSAPAVWKDILFVGSMEGRLIALRLKDGSRVWTQKLGAAIWAGISVGSDYIITATTDGSLVNLNHEGKVLWRVKPGGGILSSPLCLEKENRIIFGTKDKCIYAYSISKGDLMWRYATGGEVNGSPVSDGSTVLVGSDDGNIYALTRNGRLLWKKGMRGAVKSKPLILDGTVFITSYGSRLLALDIDAGEIIDEYVTGSPVYSSPASDGSSVFFGSNEGVFYALKLYTGTS